MEVGEFALKLQVSVRISSMAPRQIMVMRVKIVWIFTILLSRLYNLVTFVAECYICLRYGIYHWFLCISWFPLIIVCHHIFLVLSYHVSVIIFLIKPAVPLLFVFKHSIHVDAYDKYLFQLTLKITEGYYLLN